MVVKNKYIMATNQHQQEVEKQYYESFKKFSNLYKCEIEVTDVKIRQLHPFKLPMNPGHPIEYVETDQIAIKMPRDEFERFMQNWQQYIDLMYTSKYNELIGEQFHKLQMLIQLVK
jgi:hypothetical protein